MKKQKSIKIVFVQILVLTVFCAGCFAIENGIGNPTVPPSSVNSGLIKSPNPVDTTTGNLMVTGNVSGLSYFHGNVPYRSPTDFQGPLGSDSVDSFLRLTAPISSPTTPRFLPQPYYSPSRNVSSLAPNALGTALTYPSIRATGGTGEFVAPPIPKVEGTSKIQIPAVSPLYDYSRIRPLSYEPTDLERSLSYELIREKNKEALSTALQKASRGMNEITTEEQQAGRPVEKQVIPQPTEPAKPTERFKPLEPLQPGEVSETEVQKPAGTKDVYEQMLEETKKASQPQEEKPGGQKMKQEEQKKEQEKEQEKEQNQAEKPKEKGPSGLKSELGEVEKQTAKAIGEVHKSFATEAKGKFNYCGMRHTIFQKMLSAATILILLAGMSACQQILNKVITIFNTH